MIAQTTLQAMEEDGTCTTQLDKEEEEEMNRARAREKSRAGGAEEVSVEGSYSGNGVNINSFSLLSGGMSSSSPPASSSAQAFRMDESLQFERADEVRLFIEEMKLHTCFQKKSVFILEMNTHKLCSLSFFQRNQILSRK